MGLFDKLFGGKKPEKEGNTEGTTKSGNAVNNAEGTSKTESTEITSKGETAANGADAKTKAETVAEQSKSECADKALLKYEYHYGGNMNGNSHRETAMPVDDMHARISIEHADWYFEDPKVDEYLVDISVMEELKGVFCRYCMEQWHNREFTDEFVCDGETYGYHFDFGEKEVWFSSMVFPREYSEKLDEFHKVFERYTADGERLPGLVMPRTKETEEFSRRPEKGKIVLDVYEYCQGNLYYRIGNGTDETVEWTDAALYRKGESEPIVTVTEKYPNRAGTNMFHEEYLELSKQLEAGKYLLKAGGYKCVFEVK